MQTHKNKQIRYTAALVSALIMAAGTVKGQQAPAPASEAPKANVPAATETTATAPGDEDVLELSPFEVSASDSSKGYVSATTLAGNRLATEVRDLGTSVSVINSQFLKDIGATDNQSLLQYTLGSEVGNYYGNFAGVGDGAALDESAKFNNPNQNTRVRGLAAADNTRDFYLTSIPWEGYNVDGVDLQRGPNSILFGQGSPAGIINTRTKSASFKNSNEVTSKIGSSGTLRETVDFNRVLVKGQLALRVAAVANDEKYEQKPAFDSQKRFYAATRWEPEFLKKNGAKTIIKANFEAGKTSSNRPRSLPPIDLITPWFRTGTYTGYLPNPAYDKNIAYDPAHPEVNPRYIPHLYNNLNRETFIPSQLQDDNTGRANHGQNRPSINGGPNAGKSNPAYQPYIGNYGSQFGGPLVAFNGDSTVITSNNVAEPTFPYGINPAGAIDRGLGMPYQRPGGVATMAAFAKNANLPYGKFGVYKDVQLTDPSIFNFYTNLMDGPNKKEWQSFRVYNLSIAQTFFNDKFGFEVTHNGEHYKGGQLSLLSGERQAIYIDLNKVYADGTPFGVAVGENNNEPFANGTPNPNVGRAFITDNGMFGNQETINDYTTDRATLFVNHDFARGNKDNWILRSLGSHTLTGLFAKDEQKTSNMAWQRYATSDEYAKFVFPTKLAKPVDGKEYEWETKSIGDNSLVPNTFIYLGGSLSGLSSASGANLPRPSAIQTVTSGTVRTFDSHWNKSTDPTNSNYVDPNAFWGNAYYPSDQASYTSTQSENPANYVGWVNLPYTVIDSEAAAGNRDLLAREKRQSIAQEVTKAVIWQGKLFDNSIVGTFGIRNDNISGSQSQWIRNTERVLNKVKWVTPPASKSNETSKSWSLVSHLNTLPGVGKIIDHLPVNLSVSYNRSTNFQPAALRTDLYGDPLALPSGKTNDLGILIETKDGKYSLKINKFKSTVTNASSTALNGAWFIGASQAWSGNWANRFEFDWSSNTISGKIDNPPDWQLGMWNYGQAPGESAADAAAREQRAIAGWRAWQASVDPRFYKAWGINLNDYSNEITSNAPGGFTVTEDAKSEGYEIELNAQPTKNWRLTLNASKIDAVRNNIGGKLITDFVNAYQNALNSTTSGAGDLRIWWGGAGNETTTYQWYQNIGGEYASRKLQEGTNVPEARVWHINAISNYDFDAGKLKGFNIGGGLRYQSSVIIGYPPSGDPWGTEVNFDLTKPYKGPADTNFDLWIGYNRKLTSKINWSVQLNIRNLFVGDELIPITVQPDGSAAGFRIRPPQVWSLTNTFNF